MVKLNFEGVRKECPPSGQYIFVISDARIAPTKAGDSKNLNLRLQEENTGFPAYVTLNLKPQALWAVQFFMDAVLGEEQNEELELDEDEDGNVTSLIGEKVGADCTQEVSDKGRKYLKPNSWFNPNQNWVTHVSSDDEPF